jgi:hypothetical protein
MAILAAGDIVNTLPQVSVYTFGAPRVGNQGWKEQMQARLKNRVLRFYNPDDLVPKMPMESEEEKEQWVSLIDEIIQQNNNGLPGIFLSQINTKASLNSWAAPVLTHGFRHQGRSCKTAPFGKGNNYERLKQKLVISQTNANLFTDFIMNCQNKTELYEAAGFHVLQTSQGNGGYLAHLEGISCD